MAALSPKQESCLQGARRAHSPRSHRNVSNRRDSYAGAVGLLRAINIPAEAARSELVNCPPGVAGHYRPSFPSVDLSTAHADNVCHRYFGAGISGQLHVSELFFTAAEMDNLFINPDLDCIGLTCNTVGEQASHNFCVFEIQTCADQNCTALGSDYVRFGPDYVRDFVLRDEFGLVFPPFTEAEKDTIIADIEAYLRLLGDGDLELGKSQFWLRGAHPNSSRSVAASIVPAPDEDIPISIPPLDSCGIDTSF